MDKTKGRAPGEEQARRDQFKERVINAIPESARKLVVRLAELSCLKFDLIGRTAFKPWLDDLPTSGADAAEGFVSLFLGTLSLPSFSRLLGFPGFKLFLLYQVAKTGQAVTYGYAIQVMENDAVEQAFKTIPEPGKQARRFGYKGLTSSARNQRSERLLSIQCRITIDSLPVLG